MNDLYNRFLGSFDNEPKGFSSKKLTAFALTLVIIAIHVKWLLLGDFSQLEMVLTIDYAFIASLFGMTTYQSMKSQPKTTTSTVEQQQTDNSNKTIVTNEQTGGEISTNVNKPSDIINKDTPDADKG